MAWDTVSLINQGKKIGGRKKAVQRQSFIVPHEQTDAQLPWRDRPEFFLLLSVKPDGKEYPFG